MTRSRSLAPARPEEAGQRFHKGLLIDQCVTKSIALNRLAHLRESQMLLRQDGLRAEHHLHVGEPVCQVQQHLDAAGKGDGLQRRIAGEQLLPARLLRTQQLGPEHGERLGGQARSRDAKQIGNRSSPSKPVDIGHRDGSAHRITGSCDLVPCQRVHTGSSTPSGPGFAAP